MFQEMKKQIADGVEKLKADGEAKARQVQDTVHDAVANARHQTKNKAVSLRNVANEATTAAVKELKRREVATEAHIKAAVQGTIAGVVSAEQTAVEKTRLELWLLKARLKEEEGKLANNLREALQGAKESTAALAGDAKNNVETAIDDAKLQYAEALGQTEETIKEAVGAILTKGENVEAMVAQATKDATERALAQANYSARRIRTVTYTVISAAVKSAEAAGSNVAEVTKGAIQGTGEGISSAMESIRQTSTSASAKSIAFLEADLAQTKKDMRTVEELLIDAAKNVGERSQDATNEVSSQAKATAAMLRAKANDVSSWISKRLNRN